MDDPDLCILPTHRELVDLPNMDAAQILSRAANWFEISPVADFNACMALMAENTARHAFGLYDGRFHVLTLKHPDRLERDIPGPEPIIYKSLDITILHELLLRQALGLTDKELDETHLRYHRDPRLAIEDIDAARGNVAFLVNPTRIEQVKACGLAIKMPQKSTDFYPKMVTGLTMMPVEHDQRI